MTFHEEIVALQARLARAYVERDTWRASGQQAKYLESHSMIEALELQLKALREEGVRRQAARDLASNGARFDRRKPDGALDERARLLAQFAITYDGRQYRYGRHRYDRLADAVAHARLRRSAPSSGDARLLPLPTG